MKACSKCGCLKSLDDFYKRPRNRGGYEAHCKACAYEKQRAYYLANKDKFAGWKRAYRERHPTRARDQWRLAKYGLTPSEWNELFTSQGERCAICDADSPGERAEWQTDHCHESGRVRAILCRNCNVALGLMADSPERLRAAADYIELHDAAASIGGE